MRGAVAAEGQIGRPAFGIVAGEGGGDRRQQLLDPGGHGERRVVHRPTLGVGKAPGRRLVQQARPEQFGEIGPLGALGELLADGVVAVMLRQRVGALAHFRQGEEAIGRLPQISDAGTQPIRAGQDQEAFALQLARQLTVLSNVRNLQHAHRPPRQSHRHSASVPLRSAPRPENLPAA